MSSRFFPRLPPLEGKGGRRKDGILRLSASGQIGKKKENEIHRIIIPLTSHESMPRRKKKGKKRVFCPVPSQGLRGGQGHCDDRQTESAANPEASAQGEKKKKRRLLS